MRWGRLSDKPPFTYDYVHLARYRKQTHILSRPFAAIRPPKPMLLRTGVRLGQRSQEWSAPGKRTS